MTERVGPRKVALQWFSRPTTAKPPGAGGATLLSFDVGSRRGSSAEDGASVAERVGFEPTEGRPSMVFKTTAFDRSATSPRLLEPAGAQYTRFIACC